MEMRELIYPKEAEAKSGHGLVGGSLRKIRLNGLIMG
mgnify:CR=1 FL=1